MSKAASTASPTQTVDRLNTIDEIDFVRERRNDRNRPLSQRVTRSVCGHRSARKDPAMGLFSKDIQTFDDLFLHTLAREQIVKSLPR